MRTRGILVGAGVLVLASCATRVRSATNATDPIVGTWELVSRSDSVANGRTFVEPSLGSDPVALLIYDRAGHVAAQLMRRDRSGPVVSVSRSDANNSVAVNGYDAYFGTYVVDRATGTVRHTLAAALLPGDVGKTLTRHFRLDGDRLTIFFDSRSPAGEQATRTVVWRRVSR